MAICLRLFLAAVQMMTTRVEWVFQGRYTWVMEGTTKQWLVRKGRIFCSKVVIYETKRQTESKQRKKQFFCLEGQQNGALIKRCNNFLFFFFFKVGLRETTNRLKKWNLENLQCTELIVLTIELHKWEKLRDCEKGPGKAEPVKC